MWSCAVESAHCGKEIKSLQQRLQQLNQELKFLSLQKGSGSGSGGSEPLPVNARFQAVMGEFHTQATAACETLVARMETAELVANQLACVQSA